VDAGGEQDGANHGIDSPIGGRCRDIGRINPGGRMPDQAHEVGIRRMRFLNACKRVGRDSYEILENRF